MMGAVLSGETSSEIASERVEPFFDMARAWFTLHYGKRPGFRLRENLHWPKNNLIQRQLNLYVGSRAGLEIYYEQARGANNGVMTIRRRGRLEHHAQVYAALFGVGVGLIAFLIVISAGLDENWFTRPSRILPEPHFHGGAFLLAPIISSLIAGLLATAAAWPLTLISRPLCRVANRNENLVTPDRLFEILIKQ